MHSGSIKVFLSGIMHQSHSVTFFVNRHQSSTHGEDVGNAGNAAFIQLGVSFFNC